MNRVSNFKPASDEPVDAIVVGGGLAGLTAAAIVAKAGKSVVVLEKARTLGGRAATQVEQGVHFNLGAHALYCHGHAFDVLTRLGVRISGRFPSPGRAQLWLGGTPYAFPLDARSLLPSRLLTWREKWTLARIYQTLPKVDTRSLDRISLAGWIREVAGDGNLALFLAAVFRVATYGNDHERMSAGAAIDQLNLSLAGNVWYLDGGWQTSIDELRAVAVRHGATVQTSARAARVECQAGATTVHLADGTRLRSRAAILAVPPAEACELAGLPHDAPLRVWSEHVLPVRAACLDVALDKLPRPEHRFALGLDRAFYFSVHSAAAKLAPEGVSVVHLMKYLGPEAQAAAVVEAELETFLDHVQHGWRDHIVTRRYLPSMSVAAALPRADEGGLGGRPEVVIEARDNLFVAGDWVSSRGMLADASAHSAERAAQRVLERLAHGAARIDRRLVDAAS